MKRGINAFPSGNMDCVEPELGMTLRDYFAAAALQGLLTQTAIYECAAHEEAAELAYEYADAMLRVRGNEGGE